MPRCVVSVLLLCIPLTAAAQSDAVMPVSGTVVSVQRVSPPGLIGRVRITIEAAGRLTTFEEWSALWARGDRYRIGETVTTDLFAPSGLGLTSEASAAPARDGSPAENGRTEIEAPAARRPAAEPAELPLRPCATNAGRGCLPARESE